MRRLLVGVFVFFFLYLLALFPLFFFFSCGAVFGGFFVTAWAPEGGGNGIQYRYLLLSVWMVWYGSCDTYCKEYQLV